MNQTKFWLDAVFSFIANIEYRLVNSTDPQSGREKLNTYSYSIKNSI